MTKRRPKRLTWKNFGLDVIVTGEFTAYPTAMKALDLTTAKIQYLFPDTLAGGFGLGT